MDSATPSGLSTDAGFEPALRRGLAHLEMFRDGQRPTGLSTGFPALDDVVGGLIQRQLVVVASAPGIGKSCLALSMARHVAISGGKRVLIFALETTELEVVSKVLAAECRIPLTRLRSGALTDEDWGTLERHDAALANAPLRLLSAPCHDVDELVVYARRLNRWQSLDMVLIDGVDLLDRHGSRLARSDPYYLGPALANLAHDLEAAVVVTCDLDPPDEARWSRPSMRDLRARHSIDPFADVVLLLDREDAYVRESPRAGEADVIIEKNRNGQLGSVVLHSQLHYARFIAPHQ